MALRICDSKTDLHQKELLQHGDASFPIACYEDDLNIITVPWHWHEEWEFIRIQKGVTTILLESTQVHLSAGEGIFINSRALHAIDRLQSRDSVLHSAVFHPRLIGGSHDSIFWEKLVRPLLDENSPNYVLFTQDAPIHKQMLDDFEEAWKEIAQDTEDCENRARYLLSHVCYSLCKHCTDPQSLCTAQDRIDAERIRQMLAYIDAHCAQELNVQQIAASVNISESVCLRCFHRRLGITPIQYVKQLRLDKAAELLRCSSMTIKAIAFECGFHDVSHFTKSFREKMGYTPKDYQNRCHQSHRC